MLIESKTTILFEEPFWIGVFERIYDGEYQVFKHTFGPEPKNQEVYEFILENYNNFNYSKPILVSEKVEKKVNPKKLKKKISKELNTVHIGTKAQKAIKLQYEENKFEKRKISKEKKEVFLQRKFDLKQEKRKQKHKGH